MPQWLLAGAISQADLAQPDKRPQRPCFRLTLGFSMKPERTLVRMTTGSLCHTAVPFTYDRGRSISFRTTAVEFESGRGKLPNTGMASSLDANVTAGVLLMAKCRRLHQSEQKRGGNE